MRTGVRIGVDVGEVRIGVARSDPAGSLAVPVEVVARGTGDVARIAALAGEYEALEVIVGLPLSMSGREGPAAVKVRAFVDGRRRRARRNPGAAGRRTAVDGGRDAGDACRRDVGGEGPAARRCRCRRGHRADCSGSRACYRRARRRHRDR